MPARVADASVIAAAAFDEPESDRALSLLQGADLYEPPLLHYELASIARKKILRDPAQTVYYERGLENALAIELRWVEMDQAAVLKLALWTGLTTYEASYLYVARAIGAPLVTFDEQLSRVSRSVT